MRRSALVVLFGVFGSLGLPLVHSPASAQQPACLHGPQPTAAEEARRRSAVAFTRHVNTMQVRVLAATKSFQSEGELPLTQAVPDGFVFRMTATSQSYAFSVQDARDPCRFAFFSDQGGLIFAGEAIR